MIQVTTQNLNELNDMQLAKNEKFPPFINITEYSEHMHFARK